ncbi:MAG: hypothetical protein AAF356_06150 [Planctomycetota bacterium]
MMRTISTLSAMTLAAATLALCGCAAGSGLFPKDQRVDAETIDGDWLDADGQLVMLDSTVGGGLSIVAAPGDNGEPSEQYTGVLFDINGVTVMEVLLSTDLQRGNAPVYHYARLDLQDSGRSLVHQPLRSDWLNDQAGAASGVRSEQADDGSSVQVTVGDPGAMRGLLRRAVRDDGAWGEPETLTRAE